MILCYRLISQSGFGLANLVASLHLSNFLTKSFAVSGGLVILIDLMPYHLLRHIKAAAVKVFVSSALNTPALKYVDSPLQISLFRQGR